MICGGCGLQIDEETAKSLVKCPRCQKPFKDYQDAHIPAREEAPEQPSIPGINICEECGAFLVFEEGCKKCSDPACGWSACG